MKKCKGKRNLIRLALMVLMLCMLSACGKKEATKGSGKQETVAEIPKMETEGVGEIMAEEAESSDTQTEPSQDMSFQEDVIQYGDTVKASCTVWEKKPRNIPYGKQEFVVDENCEVFWSEFDDSPALIQKNLEEAIGTPEGNTFCIWTEGGDGLYGYRYLVEEIVDCNREIVEPGDEVKVSIVEYTDTQCQEIFMDGIELWLVLPQEKLDISYEPKLSCYELYPMQEPEKILGKTIGESFAMVRNGKEVVYTIESVNKAVRYGDRVKTSLEVVEYMAGEEIAVATYEDLELKLCTSSGRMLLGEELLSEELTRQLLRSLVGAATDTISIVSDENVERKRTYMLRVEDVTGHSVSEEFPEKELMLAKEEDIYRFYDEIANPMFVAVYIPEEQEYVIYDYYPEFGEQKAEYVRVSH